MISTPSLNDDRQKFIHLSFVVDSIHTNSSVFIKPNFTFSYSKGGIATNPLISKEILSIIKDPAGRAIIGESKYENYSFSANATSKEHGIKEICKETGS
jgi:hypothetical protein